MSRTRTTIFQFLSMILICFSSSLLAQPTETLTARVVDEKNEGVPFASVRLIKYNSGVITNADGSFQIPAQHEFLTDTLVISCIGFRTRRVAMAGLDPSKQNTIRLQSSAVELTAVEIRAANNKRLTGSRIVERAIKRIPYNYPTSPFAYIAYYRDYQLKDNQYVNLNEALVQVIDGGFETDDQLKTRVQLIEYRQNPAFTIDTVARQPYDNRKRKFIPNATLKNFHGNELATLMVHDPIRNHEVVSFSFINKFDRDFLYNHRFSMAGRIVEDGRELYIVSFVSNDRVSGTEHQAIGRLFIEKENYRIHKLQYSTNEWQEHKAVPIYTVNVEYALRAEKMYLNYISFNNTFRMGNANDFRVLSAHQSTDSAGFIVRFSHEPTMSALEPGYYDFRINGKRVDVRKVVFTEGKAGNPKYHLEVLVLPRHKSEFDKELKESVMKSMTIDFHGITDLAGREINIPTYIDATQYREIFVQQLLNSNTKPKQYPEMNKNTPLYAIPGTENHDASSKYWMNTPLKTEIKN
ncbi:carboxypeptidase-like regulatory domain-containing protein [Chryseolinea sp. T2]|uniref:carboxypeptidase-like regulatory domain-containing protein n=1 Tax=Chryseolinea sp. T2 TaxID=3129255 RepID=UPI0030779AC6